VKAVFLTVDTYYFRSFDLHVLLDDFVLQYFLNGIFHELDLLSVHIENLADDA